MPLPLSELAATLNLPFAGGEDPVIAGAAGFLEAEPDQIAFVDDPKLLRRLDETRAGALVVGEDVDIDRPCLRVPDPRAAFVAVLGLFAPPLESALPAGVHPSAHVDPTAEVADGAALGPGCVVGPRSRVGSGTRLGAHVVLEADVTVGRDCCLYHQVVVRERCRLGDGVTLHPGVVIGTDGFGYHPGPEGLVKIPQIGVVVLEDRVEIGANSCIDRATAGETVIGAGTKIDNQCQVGHNVMVGRHCAISAQTGVSGSCRIGNGVTMGGQAGVADHLEVGDGAKVAAKAGIIRNVPPGGTVFGYPAIEFQRAFRLVAHYHRLPEFAKRLQALEAARDGKKGEEKDSC